ncbi:uncharacterized protein LOC141651220 [Silene latifolia]|uniref:uncharacterized protein LOC141651220 n=1 Tax=Silene latifolia TaxID=37657 RepID=UPI003D774618
MPRAEGPYKVIEKVNDNAYKIELPGDYGVHAIFNVGDLSPYLDDDGISELRTIPFKGGGDDTILIDEEVNLDLEQLNKTVPRTVQIHQLFGAKSESAKGVVCLLGLQNVVVRTKPDAAKKFFGSRAFVNPTVFKDSEGHLYAKFSAGGKGCINTQYPCFVQVDRKVPLVLIPEIYSQIQGVKWTWDITIEKHQDDGNWWLSIFARGGKNKILIGYWPNSLFITLAGVASQVEWGGEIDNPGIKEPQPDMGSGKKAHYDTKVSAFFQTVTVVSENSQTVDPSDTEKYEDCIPFYTTLDDGNKGSYWGRLIFYGGVEI